MPIRSRWPAVLVAVSGLGVCVVALGGFIGRIVTNNLPWAAESFAREHYLAVGRSYSEGFMIGFFFCFFLMMAAVALRPAGRRAAAGPSLERRG
jgi:hypothetical protein